MKKVLLITLASIALLTCVTGCGKSKEKQQEQNTEIVDNIKDLQTDGEIKEFEGLLVLNERTLESHIGLTIDDVDNFIAQVPVSVDSRLYLVFKPAKGKEEKVKRLAGLYIDSIITRLESQIPLETEDVEVDPELKKSYDMIKNYKFEEYKGYLIYISSSDNDKVLKTIKKGL